MKTGKFFMIEAIRKRRSVRAFLKRDVAEEKLREILTSAMFAPTSWGTKAWEFIIVRDTKTRVELSKSTDHSGFVKEAPVVIIICYDVKTGKRFREDSSIAAGHILLEAVNQGLAGCFVQVADAGMPQGSAEPYVKKLLKIPERFRVQCMLPIGYPKRPLQEHKDSEFDENKIHYENF